MWPVPVPRLTPPNNTQTLCARVREHTRARAHSPSHTHARTPSPTIARRACAAFAPARFRCTPTHPSTHPPTHPPARPWPPSPIRTHTHKAFKNSNFINMLESSIQGHATRAPRARARTHAHTPRRPAIYRAVCCSLSGDVSDGFDRQCSFQMCGFYVSP